MRKRGEFTADRVQANGLRKCTCHSVYAAHLATRSLAGGRVPRILGSRYEFSTLLISATVVIFQVDRSQQTRTRLTVVQLLFF